MDDLHILNVKTQAQMNRITYFFISLYILCSSPLIIYSVLPALL